MRTIDLTIGRDRQRILVKDAGSWGLVVDALMPVLEPGTVIALSGPLGAGKTACVQAIALALGVTKSPQSPTFALMRSYRLPAPVNGVRRLVHVDAYRIEDEKDIAALDLDEELADGASVVLIEWPEKIPKWLSAHAHIRMDIGLYCKYEKKERRSDDAEDPRSFSR